MSLPAPLQPGDTFLEYRITDVVDRGGMGEVYRAVDEYSEDIVAIKCMSPRHRSREDFARRFRQECKFYPKLRHPHIVSMRRAGVSPDNVAFIVMEFLEGRTLRRLLAGAYRFDFLNALYIMLQVAEAMRFVHSKKIWHRDLKPENIMIGMDGDARGHVWLLDFGIAKFADGGLNTDDMPDVGTIRYMSPEQVKTIYNLAKKIPHQKPDSRADIYAFGAIFYEVLTGRHLFIDDADPPSAEETLAGHLLAEPVPVHELVPDCPEIVWPLVARCVAIDRNARFQTFTEVESALRALVDECVLQRQVPPAHALAQHLAHGRWRVARQAAFSAADLDRSDGSGGAGARPASEAEAAATASAAQPAGAEAPAVAARPAVAAPPASAAHATVPLDQLRLVPLANALPFAPASGSAPGELRGKGFTERMPTSLPLPALPARARSEPEIATQAFGAPPGAPRANDESLPPRQEAPEMVAPPPATLASPWMSAAAPPSPTSTARRSAAGEQASRTEPGASAAPGPRRVLAALPRFATAPALGLVIVALAVTGVLIARGIEAGSPARPAPALASSAAASPAVVAPAPEAPAGADRPPAAAEVAAEAAPTAAAEVAARDVPPPAPPASSTAAAAQLGAAAPPAGAVRPAEAAPPASAATPAAAPSRTPAAPHRGAPAAPSTSRASQPARPSSPRGSGAGAPSFLWPEDLLEDPDDFYPMPKSAPRRAPVKRAPAPKPHPRRP
ncbi:MULTISPECIES: protein kinase domain-containing protein [Sorangium]|uniref:serine/threonine-protein kinase n=1 Tax=Sorangium TaxID=39643 RepID=UPI003D9C14D4